MRVKMRDMSTLARLSCGLAAHCFFLTAAMLMGCASDAPLATSTVSLAAPSNDAEKSTEELAENAELVASATEVPVIANAPRVVCRREIPVGSRIGREVCTVEGGPLTAKDELQRIQTQFELEEHRLDQLLNVGGDDPLIQGSDGSAE